MASDADFKHPLVLIVDDVAENLELLCQILKPEGYSFALAATGSEVFAVLDQKLPDLILLDIMLPDMDGFDIMKRLHDTKRTQGIPVIFVTARHNLADKVRGFEAGAVDYITKPFEELDVKVRVKTHIALKKSMDERQALIDELQKTLNEIKELKGIIPICSHCKKIRNDKGYWEQLERYLSEHTAAEFSHGLCPDCLGKFYPDLAGNIIDEIGKGKKV